ncbi:MAG: hypothetical protein ACI9KE_001397 [Polyangiales bacterium]|jgi:hypothetical protein
MGRERTMLFCAGGPDENYLSRSGDCNYFWDQVHPEAEEPCNQRDDNCNDIIDDGAEEVTHYPDSDRVGFYFCDERESGDEFFGCSEPRGRWVSRGGDCAPDDEARNSDVEDVCDLLDNDCDGNVDERTRPQCGTGWCRRNSTTCDVDDGEPGPPEDETCNLFDGDCDGIADEGTCPAGQSCIDFECTDDGAGPGPGPEPVDPPGDEGGCAPGAQEPLLMILPGWPPTQNGFQGFRWGGCISDHEQRTTSPPIPHHQRAPRRAGPGLRRHRSRTEHAYQRRGSSRGQPCWS